MSGTYKTIGINLKSTPLGESDRLLTILSEDHGLLRAVAPGSRKQNSSLSGRSNLFVVNQLLIAKGKTLDKIIQAESLASYPGLSQDLRKLTVSQYLAELTLCQALSDQPQTELFCLLRRHLDRLEQHPAAVALAHLNHATFHLLALAGLAPQVEICCISQQPISPNMDDPDWRAGFSVVAGGVVQLAKQTPELSAQITATELYLLQQLAQLKLDITAPTVPISLPALNHPAWLSVERLLRHYAQYHFDRPIRSAVLIDTCFSALTPSLLQTS